VNRIIVMDRGRMVMDGPRDAVLARLTQAPPTPPPATSRNQPAT
jgi:ABC-type glutathione transport system ATPase component